MGTDLKSDDLNTDAVLLQDAAREAFRLRHNAQMQMSNIGITALNLVGKADPALQEAAHKLFKGNHHAMGLWFVTPDTKSGRSPLQEYNDGNGLAVRNTLNFNLALRMM